MQATVRKHQLCLLPREMSIVDSTLKYRATAFTKLCTSFLRQHTLALAREPYLPDHGPRDQDPGPSLSHPVRTPAPLALPAEEMAYAIRNQSMREEGESRGMNESPCCHLCSYVREVVGAWLSFQKGCMGLLVSTCTPQNYHGSGLKV